MKELSSYAPWKESLSVSAGMHELASRNDLPHKLRIRIRQTMSDLPASMARVFSICEKHEKLRALSSAREEVQGLENLIDSTVKSGKLPLPRAEHIRHRLVRIRHQLSTQMHMLSGGLSSS